VIELSGRDVPTVDELRAYLTGERKLAVWKSPERIEIVTEWPVTATGKVQKYVLRRRFA
jgi:cyclohexanecarboxylate-CoA ligase